MAKAAADGSAKPALPTADDLLSQLAGEEVDRLLADAELDADLPRAPLSSAPAVSEALSTNERRHAAADDAIVPDLPAPSLLAKTEAFSGEKIGDEIDQLFSTLHPSPGSIQQDASDLDAGSFATPAIAAPVIVPEVAAPVAPADPAEAAEAARLEALAADLELDGTAPRVQATAAPVAETSAVKPAVLMQPTTQAASVLPKASASSLHGLPEIHDDGSLPTSDQLPWWLRPLEWINAPLASASDEARSRLGWVAITTTLFAAGILAWVAFRRHHGQ